MKDFIDRIMKRPGVVHLMRAVERFGNRLGSQFASAVTYFSVLAMVPIIMIAFSMLGLILTVLRPDLLETVKAKITGAIGGPGGSGGEDDPASKISILIDNLLSNWQGVGTFALIAALYAGSNWIGNLRSAIRSQWRDEWPELPDQRNFFVVILMNFLVFLGMLALMFVGIGLAVSATSLNKFFLDLLGLGSSPVAGWFLRLGVVLLNFLVSWLLVLFLFWTLPGERVPLREFMIGSIAAAVGVTALQQLAGFVTGLLSANKAAQLFGPVIILMLFMNLLATIIMFAAAWIGTSKLNEDGEIDEKVVTPMVIAKTSTEGPTRKLKPDEFPTVQQVKPVAQVPEEVAVKSVRAGLMAGYGVGTATGVGIGAVIVAIFKKIFSGKKTK